MKYAEFSPKKEFAHMLNLDFDSLAPKRLLLCYLVALLVRCTHFTFFYTGNSGSLEQVVSIGCLVFKDLGKHLASHS